MKFHLLPYICLVFTLLYSTFLIISQIVELLKAFPYTAWKFHHNTYDDKWKYGKNRLLQP